MITSYSPNTEWGKQVVEITLKQWDYASTFKVEVGGNCLGFDVFECAANNLYEQLLPPENDPEGDVVARVTLTQPGGDTLLCEDDEDHGDRWLKRMIVAITIVDYKPPTLNEVRAMNGAAPVEGGDVPHHPL